MTPLSRFQQAKWPYPESNTESDSIGIGLSTKASKDNAGSCSHHPSAIAVRRNLKHANRTSVHNSSKGRSVHTATGPENPVDPELDFNEQSGEDCSEDEIMAACNPDCDAVSIPEQDALDADVQALLNDNDKEEDNQLLLTQIQEDLLLENDTTEALNDKLADIILGLCSQKLSPEKIKARLNKVLRPKNCDLFVPKCNKDIWSDKIDIATRQFDLTMQKDQNMTLHCTYGIISMSDKAAQIKSQNLSEIASMSIDLAALLTNAMHDINQIRRDCMKPKLGSLAKLANKVSPNAPLLFGSEDGLTKKITKIMAAQTAMAKSTKGKFTKNFKTPHTTPAMG